jgi:hypothetical protein
LKSSTGSPTPRSRSSDPANKDVIEAAKNLAMMDLAILKAEAAAAEVRAVVVAAWTRGGLLPKLIVEQMVPTRIG